MVKNGCARGYKRRRYKTCGHSAATRAMALKLYASGVSMNRVGQLPGASCQSVVRWVPQAGAKAETQLPSGRIVSVEAPVQAGGRL